MLRRCSRDSSRNRPELDTTDPSWVESKRALSHSRLAAIIKGKRGTTVSRRSTRRPRLFVGILVGVASLVGSVTNAYALTYFNVAGALSSSCVVGTMCGSGSARTQGWNYSATDNVWSAVSFSSEPQPTLYVRNRNSTSKRGMYHWKATSTGYTCWYMPYDNRGWTVSVLNNATYVNASNGGYSCSSL
jgi:hypothetical protein